MKTLALLSTIFSIAACASIDTHIVNGDIVSPPNKYPWQLSLKTSSHICGAVVYNNNFAITAAHCINPSTPTSYTIECGVFDRMDLTDGRQSIQISAITRHPQYSSNSAQGFPNDVAVLKLSRPLTFNDKCQPATFPSGSGTFEGQDAVITGWGRLYGNGPLPDKLMKGDVQVLSPSLCRSYWGNTVNDNYHICMKDLGDRIYQACNGDSGGPSHVGNTVVGLASWVASGCLTNYPSAYTRLSFYMNWVESTIAAMS